MTTSLPSPRRVGLSTADAESRRLQYGSNRIESGNDETLLHEILESLREPLVLLLLGVGVLYVVFGEYRDAAIIFGVIITVAATEASIEFRASKAVKALADLAAPTVFVWRDGAITERSADTLVPGDVIELRAGSRVPADVKLVASDNVAADESLLTGESQPVEHSHADAVAAVVAAGSLIVRGSAQAEVVRIGVTSTLGKIVELVAQTKPPKTPLQRRMAELARALPFVAITVSVLIPLAGFLAGRPFREMLLTGLSLAFATIPEELPVLIVVILGLGSLKLARDGAIVRQLRAAETLGAITMICTDKTGTLTENRMTVAAALGASDIGSALHRPIDPLVLAHAAIASERDSAGGSFIDPMDSAIYAASAPTPNATKIYPFDPAARLASGYVDENGAVLAAVKGAPETILSRCTSWRLNGAIQPLSTAIHDQLLRSVATQGSSGRVIAIASRALSAPPRDRQQIERDLVFDGIVILVDPIRPEVPDAIRALRGAGVNISIVTGDQATTARAVATEIGLPESVVMTGAELREMNTAALVRHAAAGLIVARATPADKLLLVQALSASDEVVMVTGDGANDGPALKAAAVGVAMGRVGSDVARESADVVLTNDSFATLARAVRDGRGLYDNFRKAIRFYLAIKIALVLVTAVAAVSRLPLPFTPVQIVLLELFMDLGAALAFIRLPTDPDVMGRPPRKPDAPFFDRSMLTWMGSGALVLATLVFTAFLYGLHISGETAARTYAIVAWLVGHVALGVAMSGSLKLRQNVPLLGWMAGSLTFAGLVATVPAVAGSIAASVIRPENAFVVAAIAAAGPLLLLLPTVVSKRPRHAHQG